MISALALLFVVAAAEPADGGKAAAAAGPELATPPAGEGPGAAAELKESGPDDGSLPAPVEELFAEKSDDGKAILGDKERALLKKLPRHTRDLLGQKVEKGNVAGATHLAMLLALKLTSQTAAIVFADNCVLCHSDPMQKARLRFSLDPADAGTAEHLNLTEYMSDVHFRRGLSCAGCHGGKPADEDMSTAGDSLWPAKDVRHTDRTWIPQFCARCHADPSFMRNYNPAMPTDQMAKYKESKHGVLLLQEKDSNAAQCVSCHGVHGIRGPKSRKSTVHPQAIPTTCGHCHADPKHMAGYKKEDGSPLPTNQLEQYKTSVHGKALLEKGDLSAPACNDCHGNHAAMPPAVSAVSQVCRTCHAMNATLFDGSKHKKAFEKNNWPECEKCHGKHDITKPTEAVISDAKDSLCGGCHAEKSKDNPDCNAGARYFRSTLDGFVSKAKTYPAAAEHLAERGLDIDPILAAAGEIDEAIVQTRTRVHSFDKGGFDVGANAARDAIAKTDKLIEAAKEEQKFRLSGLLVAIGFMAFVAFVLWLKIRELDRRRAAGE